jgi:glycosyltransferase involved in cell wall biosynthesis
LPELESKPLQLPLRLAAVSRLAPNKRNDHAIRATALLNQRGIDSRLTIVGMGEAQADLQRLIAELKLQDRVTLAGQLVEEEKNRQLRNSHLLVHCSVREGWGLNVIEANAMGTPAIVYPVGGLVDSTVSGETGIVTAAETPESVADALATLLKTPAEYDRYRRNAWERSKTFLWDRVLPRACEWLEARARGSS